MLKILIVFICTSVFLNAQFIRNDEKKIILDSKTNLMWFDPYEIDDTSNFVKYNKPWREAKSYCSALNHAGYTDWKLPDINQLSSLLDRTLINPALSSAFKAEKDAKRKHTSFWSTTADYDTIGESDSSHKDVWSIKIYESFSSSVVHNYVVVTPEYHTTKSSTYFMCVRKDKK